MERSVSGGRDRSSLSVGRREGAVLDKFDFACFLSFLIKMAPKVYPKIADCQAATKCLMDDFIQPVHAKLNLMKSSQTKHISKLINLVNSKKMVDFMSELYCTL